MFQDGSRAASYSFSFMWESGPGSRRAEKRNSYHVSDVTAGLTGTL